MIIFDLDGTLALDHHRSDLLRQEPKDWEGYFRACEKDEPCHPLLDLVNDLHSSGNTLGLWSGRSRMVESETMRWLIRYGIHSLFDQIRLRDEHDRTADTELKLSWLREQQTTLDPVTLVFEDRKRVVDMWRAQGIICCQVAPGDF